MNLSKYRGWIVLCIDVFFIFTFNMLVFLREYLEKDVRLSNLLMHIGFLTVCVLLFQLRFKTYDLSLIHI